jgi:hypothetical protein
MMMRRTVVSGIAMMLAAASLTLSAYAQQPSTAFTYQGFLKDNNNPANAKYDLQFTLYDAPTGGNQIGNSVVHRRPADYERLVHRRDRLRYQSLQQWTATLDRNRDPTLQQHRILCHFRPAHRTDPRALRDLRPESQRR